MMKDAIDICLLGKDTAYYLISKEDEEENLDI